MKSFRTSTSLWSICLTPSAVKRQNFLRLNRLLPRSRRLPSLPFPLPLANFELLPIGRGMSVSFHQFEFVHMQCDAGAGPVAAGQEAATAHLGAHRNVCQI